MIKRLNTSIFLRKSIFSIVSLLVLNLILLSFFWVCSCKRELTEQNKNSQLTAADRTANFQIIQDSISKNPTLIAYLTELGTLKYEYGSISVMPGNFLWAQIPIVSADTSTISNLFEVIRLPNGVFQFYVHSKILCVTQLLSPKYSFGSDYFKMTLEKFKDLEEKAGLQNTIVSFRLYEEIHIQLENGLELIYNPETGEVRLAGGGGLMGYFDPVTGTWTPHTGCLFNWNTINAVAIWSGNGDHNNLSGLISPFEGGIGWHFLNQISFSPGFTLSFPSGSWGYGGTNGDGTYGNPGNINVQYEDIHILKRAQTRIKATYGLDLDINTLIHLFGIDCILQLGNLNLPPGNYYIESDCVEDILADNPILCFMQQVEAFNDHHNIDIPVNMALDCYADNPGCTIDLGGDLSIV